MRAGHAEKVLFLVDRNTLARQTEDAFAEHLPDYPCYRLQSGRRFQDEKRITITTLQSMVNIYRDYSSGYFDLVISDECHRSIYGKWSGVLRHFDGIQIGLTATPCVANLDDVSADDEDKLFVRDTLRFFEVDQPTFSYKLKDAIHDDPPELVIGLKPVTDLRYVTVEPAGVRIGALTDEDRLVVERYVPALAANLERVGHGGRFAEAYLEITGGVLASVAFEPDEAFAQTPGPKAGARLERPA